MAQPSFSMSFDFKERSSLAIYNNYLKHVGMACTISYEDLGKMNELLKTILSDSTRDPEKNPEVVTYLRHMINEMDEPVPHVPSLEDAFTRLRSWCMRQVVDGMSSNSGEESYTIEQKLSVLISKFATMMASVGAHGGNSRQIALLDGEGSLVLESMWLDDKAQAEYDRRIADDRLTDAEREAKAGLGKAMGALFNRMLDGIISDIENAIDDKKTERQPKSPVDIVNAILNKKVS